MSDTDGLLREASWLLDLGILPNSSSPSRAIGYRQVTSFHLFLVSFVCPFQGCLVQKWFFWSPKRVLVIVY